MIRESVAELYGDWGIGKLGGASAGGIQSMRPTLFKPNTHP